LDSKSYMIVGSPLVPGGLLGIYSFSIMLNSQDIWKWFTYYDTSDCFPGMQHINYS